MLRFTISSFFIVLIIVGCTESESVSDFPIVQVYKSATCGCCSKWVAHLEANGFEVKATDVGDLAMVKRGYGIPETVATCHTAIVGDYLVEGHVPAEDIVQLLKQKPAIKGIAVPGMPIGSPGMEGGNPQAYDVVSFDANGETEIFSSHHP
ncbi:MAG: DUF411 domain-containing protein [Gammaproteobacteria bacterium]|nr:DUF411 domain-containing protein [Gammaproteobacteria bacterium]